MLNALCTQLVDTLTGDATLTALLSAADAVYGRRPPRAADTPCLTLSLSEEPDAAADAVGRSRVALRIDIWTTSGDTADAIQEALDDVLFDGHRSGDLDTDDFRVGACRRASASDGGGTGSRTEDGHEIERRETLWRLTLLKKES